MNEAELSQKINDVTGLNLVTCGECGGIFTHKVEHTGELKCPYCGMQDDPCSFPDLFY